MRKSNKLVFGVGINDSTYQLRFSDNIDGAIRILWRCPFYQAWWRMIARAYSKNEHDRYPTYKNCSVDPSWHSFMAFREWMLAQDWEGKQLDKDILVPGNKVYGPENCVFVSGALNNFIIDHASSRGEWPIGVYWCKRDGKFLAQCRNPFTRNREHIGYFDCPVAAHEAWRKRKHEHACRYAGMQTDQRIAKALKERYAKPSLTSALAE